MKTKRKYLFFTFFYVFLLCSCASVQNPQYEYSDWIRPEINTVNQTAIGNTIISEGVERSTDGIELYFTDGVDYLTAYHPAGKYRYCGEVSSPIKLKGKTAKLYQFDQKYNNGWNYVYPQILEFEDGEVHLKMNIGTKKLENNQYRKIKIHEEIGDYFEQQLMYTGSEGNILKFTYREFSNSALIPTFSVDAIYDVSNDKILKYKNCKFEVIDYNNQTITYKLISGFNYH